MQPVVLRSLRLLVATAAIAMLTGLSMYAFPTRFSATIYAPLVPYMKEMSPLLVGAGISLLLLARYPLPGWLQRVLRLFPVIMMALLSAVVLRSGGFTGGLAYAALALGVLVAPPHSVAAQTTLPDSPYDLFDVVAGVIEVGVGALMLVAPGLFTNPAFQALRPIFPPLGAISVIAGALLLGAVLVPGMRSLNPWVARLPGAILPVIMMLAFYLTLTWTGVVLWFVLGATILSGNLALPHFLERVVRTPAAPVAPEDLLTARLEQILEGWLWLLALLVIVMTGLGEGGMVASPVRGTLFVILICAYNAWVHWAVPHWGDSGRRIMAHMVALILGSALLLGDAGAIGRPVVALLVVLPGLAARALSPVSGLTLLGLVLATILATGLDRLSHGDPAAVVLGETVAESLILAASAAVGLRFAFDQRQVMRDLGDTRTELDHQVRELELVDRIGRAIRGSLEMDKTIQTIVDELGPTLRAERCFIRLLDETSPDSGAFSTQYISPAITAPAPVPRHMGASSSLVVRDRATVAIADVQTDPRLENPSIGSRQDLLAMGIRSVLSVPIQTQGEMLGIITFQMFTGPRIWTRQEQNFVERVAGQVAVAILHARTHAALSHRHAELRTAHERLQVRDQELVAQQEELQAQHEELIAQSDALQAERDKLEAALIRVQASEQARERLVAVLESTSDFVVVMNPDGQIYYMNQTVRKLFGLSEVEGSVSLQLNRIYTRESLERIRRLVRPGLTRHGIWSGELTVLRHDGRTIPISQVVMAHQDAAGNVMYYSTVARDVTAGKRAEEELRQSETRFRTAFSQAPIGMALVAWGGQILRVNQALCDMMGYTEDEFLRLGIAAISHPDDRDEQTENTQRLRRREIDSYQMEKRYVHKSGRTVWTQLSVSAVRSQDGAIEYLISQVQDITERKRSEEELVHLANFDPLTDLYNRRRFQEELEHEILAAQRYGHQGALLFLDLDQFKYINDTLGHQAGDSLLVSLSALLKERLRRTDTIARLGGDEFAIILPRVDADQAKAVAASLIKSIREHVEVTGSRSYGISGSVGITLFPTQGSTVEEILANADMAMYQAKEDGRNGYCLYAPDLAKAQQMETKLTWEHRIRRALETGGFELHCQPICDLRTGQISQYELLLRMRGENGELYYPDSFLDVAERFGLIVAIDRWVVRRAIAQIAQHERSDRQIVLDVNLSGKAFADGDLLALIRKELQQTGINPSSLVFEITETAAIADKGRARRFLETLRAMGCRVALDDFGTGFSSFAYLKHLPFDYLKIDGSFIQRLPSDPVDQRVVKAVVDLARGLGKETVAEFVEDAETVGLLRELGVDYAQGYHVGRPTPTSDWLKP